MVQAQPKTVRATDVIESNESHANRDPITGEPGSHPVATTIGAAVGISAGVAAAVALGATAGTALGPVGTLVGAVVGGIFGGGVGHQIGEDIYPTQIAWWKNNYSSRPYVAKGADFSTYEPAYWYGLHAGAQTMKSEKNEKDFDNLEPSLRNNWNLARGDSTLEWDDARPAARDAFHRVRTNKLFNDR